MKIINYVVISIDSELRLNTWAREYEVVYETFSHACIKDRSDDGLRLLQKKEERYKEYPVLNKKDLLRYENNEFFKLFYRSYDEKPATEVFEELKNEMISYVENNIGDFNHTVLENLRNLRMGKWNR